MFKDSKALLAKLLDEGLSQGDATVVEQLIADDYVHHDAPFPVHGSDGFKQLVSVFRGAFPDLTVKVENEFGEGDLVGSRGTIEGTHKGDFMGIPATNKPIAIKYQDLWRVRHGKFTETWVQMDMLGLMQQLGVAPAPAA